MITNLNEFRKSIKESHMDFQEPVATKDVTIHLVGAEDHEDHSVYALFLNNKLIKTDFEDTESAKKWATENGFNVISEESNEDNTVKLRDALNNLLKQDDQFFIESYNRGYALHSGGVSDPDTNPDFLRRMVEECRRDIKFALSEFEEFYEEMVATEKFDVIVSDNDKLMSACAAHANGNPILSFVYLEKRMITERNSTVTIPGVTSQEQLAAHIMQGAQKAMDIFTAQQKMPKITVSVKGQYLNGLSQTFTEDELGVFKHGVKHAQIQISNASKLNIDESGMFNQIIWGTFSLRYEVLSGGSNGVAYMYTGNDDQFMYDIVANKFFTRNDFFSTLKEKRVTGYNNKRK